MVTINDIHKIQDERNKLFGDFYSNKIPERMPISFSLPNHLIAQYGGIDPFRFQYDFSLLKETAHELCGKIISDSLPVAPAGWTTRTPAFYGILGSKTFVMGNNGYVQHPEVAGMEADEYDELIKDPINFIASTVIPRMYKNLDPANPLKMHKAYETAKAAMSEDTGKTAAYCKEFREEFGYYKGAPLGSGGFTAAPFDYLSDQLRSFSGISVDIRRNKERIKQACEVLLPLMFLQGMPANPHCEGAVGMPLHMPPFMREKDFEQMWFPTFKKLLEQFAARGARASAFCEGDWTRYLDYLEELPAGTKLKFEYGNPKEIKDRLGKKMIIAGLYPLNTVKTGTKKECVDKAKELMEIMLPGCGYVFDFDKVPLTLADINLDNYVALGEYFRDSAVYFDAGARYGMGTNTERFEKDSSIEIIPQSENDFNKAIYATENVSTPDFALERLEKYDKAFYKFYINLLL